MSTVGTISMEILFEKMALLLHYKSKGLTEVLMKRLML